jgi:VanZ family protein
MTRWLPLFWALAFWGAVAAVLVLSLLPVDRLPEQVLDLWDKAQHAFGFAVLTVLGWLAYPHRARILWPSLLLLGAFIEVAQHATGWRYGDVLDWLADAVGVALGAVCMWAWGRLSGPSSWRTR